MFVIEDFIKCNAGLKIKKMKYAVIIPGTELLNIIPKRTTTEYKTANVNVITSITSGKLKFQ